MLADSGQPVRLRVAFVAVLALALTGAIARGLAGEDRGCFGPRSKIGWGGVARNLF